MQVHDPRMICQICPSRSKVRIYADSAERAQRTMAHLLQQVSNVKPISHQVRFADFHQPLRCNYTGGGCSHFRMEKDRMQRAHKQMQNDFPQIITRLIALFEQGDEERARQVQDTLSRSLRGDYPSQSRTVNDLPYYRR